MSALKSMIDKGINIGQVTC